MKKSFVLMVVLFATVLVAGQGDMKLGPHVGFWLPTGDYGDIFTLSPRFGAKFIYGLNDNMDIEGNLAYGLMQMNGDNAYWGDDYKYSLIDISGGVRYFLKENMHAGGGLSMNMFKWKYDGPYSAYMTDDSDSHSEIGLFGCFGMIFPQKRFSLTRNVTSIPLDINISANSTPIKPPPTMTA